IRELSEEYVAEKVEKIHDEARIRFYLTRNSVANDAEFENLIAEYYNHHFTTCVSNGGELTKAEASGRAKEIITDNYKRRKLDKLNAYADGINGRNGGMRAILDIILDFLKQEAIERHIREVIDRYIAPTIWEEQVEIIQELFNYYPDSIKVDKAHPERYARNYEELLRALIEQLNATKNKLRKF
ncbi:MAG: hypothetical protein KDC52_16545, partial [Ignavibacteriae bacterium]|nr:hypothetical protein [Ignavibacteriota bacterium]